ncbi:hypothetical protein J6590_088840 [Homalodisca vitripennis]|nr:hypothetical protein J6590_088840 [Homalodisca vitripennis]
MGLRENEPIHPRLASNLRPIGNITQSAPIVYRGIYIVIYVKLVYRVAGIRHNSTIILRATRTCTGIGKQELILVEYVTLRRVDGQSAVIGWT